MKKRILFLFTLIVGLAVVSKTCSLPSKESHFPPFTFDQSAYHDLNKRNWYSRHLRAMREPRLETLANSKSNHVYRFTCLRTSHRPFCVRIELTAQEAGKLTYKMSSGQGGYEAGVLIEAAQISLRSDQVDGFLQIFEEEGYWELPTTISSFALDGSQWIVEAVRNNRYHVVDHGDPTFEHGVGRIGTEMLKLAEKEIPDLY